MDTSLTLDFDHETEIIGELIDLFLTLLHNVIYHSSGLPEDYFFFSTMFGLKFPVRNYKLNNVESIVKYFLCLFFRYVKYLWLQNTLSFVLKKL